jgi:hypothetical protein
MFKCNFLKIKLYSYYFVLCDDFFDPTIFNKGRSEVESGKDRSSLHSFLAYMILLDRETDPFSSSVSTQTKPENVLSSKPRFPIYIYIYIPPIKIH